MVIYKVMASCFVKLKQKPEYSLSKGSISEYLIIVATMTKVFSFKEGKQNVFIL